MISICQSLVSQLFYNGAAFSAGDREIADIAQKAINSGGGQQWTQWGVSHHLEFVVNQLAHTSF